MEPRAVDGVARFARLPAAPTRPGVELRMNQIRKCNFVVEDRS